MSKKQIDVYRTGIYLRLSQGDEDVDGLEKKESNSISNQKLLLEGFIDAHDDLKLVDIFIDDGYSGSNFDRPEFQRMMASMKEGNLDCIIVKDLSRLARERIGADELIQKTFKKYNMRFIAVSEGYDSLTASSSETHTIIPFKNLLNEQYNGDTSIKVRTSQDILRRNGLFIGAFAPYGYQKAEDNKNHLVRDPYAAGVVQGIFAKKLSGMSASGIAKILNKNGVLAPSEYKAKCGEKYSTSFKGAGQSKWSAQTVSRILKNVVYIGTLAQGKRTTVSHKVKKEIEVPECDWVVVENAHEAIISRMDFDAVQILMRRDTIAVAGKSESYMYAGILYCGDCGSSMVHRKESYKGREYINYICSNYNRNGKDACSRHCIREEDLNQIVLGELQGYINSMCDCEKVLAHLDELNVNYDEAVAHDKEIVALKQELTKCSAFKASLYQDLRDEIISKEQFTRYREEFSAKERALEQAVREQETIIRDIYENGIAVAKNLERFREGLVIGNLDRVALVSFIDRILIYDDFRVEIVFKYRQEMEKVAGLFDVANEKDAEPVYTIAKALQEYRLALPGDYLKTGNLYVEEGTEAKSWYPGTISNILKNQAYIGNMVQGKRRISLYDNEARHATDENDWIVVENTHEAIVDKELFNKVRAVMDKKVEESIFTSDRGKNLPIKEDIFAGILFCGNCGRRIPLASRILEKDGVLERQYFYSCRYNYDFGGKQCGCTIMEQELIKVVHNLLTTQIAVMTDSARTEASMRCVMDRELKNHDMRIQKFQKQIDRKNYEESKEYQSYVTGEITKADFKCRQEKNADAIMRLRGQISDEEASRRRVKRFCEKKIQWLKAIYRFQSEVTLDRNMIKILVDSIYLYPDKRLVINLNFKDEYARMTDGEEI